jgi:peptide methionine sulfoxide reductase msrA/msrB
MKLVTIVSLLLTSVLILSACSGTTIDEVEKVGVQVMDQEVPVAFVAAEVSSQLVPPSNSNFPDNPNLGVEFDTSQLEEVWLAGGCFWGVESYMARIYGVYDTTSGYANGSTMNPTYQDVLSGSGHAETVHVTYDPTKISLETLLTYFFKVVDPTSLDKQGNDIGTSYRSGIYYTNEADLEVIDLVIAKEQERYTKTIVTEVLPLDGYYLAEDYHQDYLEKNPDGYCHIDFDQLGTREVPTTDMTATTPMAYVKPSDDEIKAMLDDLQYDVTQQDGTEPSFNNTYWDNHEEGIYVDVVTGEPLFSSATKYESGTGWPSFYEPLFPEAVTLHEDNTLFAKRVEVRSLYGDSHLGHVFDDGPADQGGLRYCMNSASMKFIPYDEMEANGYGSYMSMVK